MQKIKIKNLRRTKENFNPIIKILFINKENLLNIRNQRIVNSLSLQVAGVASNNQN
jgi:hypothetical protein